MTVPIRLNKALASAGLGSRRACDQLIFSGKVTLNGQLVTSPSTYVNWDCDLLHVGGKCITRPKGYVYYALNKPVGCHCTHDSRMKKRVYDFLPNDTHLFTVGRLDKGTSGLILATNDGDFAHHVMHPSFGIEKEYLVKVDQEVGQEHLEAMSRGTHVEGVFVRPKAVRKVRRGTFKIIVQDGKKHEVRTLVQEAGLTLRELKRVRIGSVRLGSLQTGEFRELLEHERNSLHTTGVQP